MPSEVFSSSFVSHFDIFACLPSFLGLAQVVSQAKAFYCLFESLPGLSVARPFDSAGAAKVLLCSEASEALTLVSASSDLSSFLLLR